jgi:hypothetical protein
MIPAAMLFATSGRMNAGEKAPAPFGRLFTSIVVGAVALVAAVGALAAGRRKATT